jgi:hypothetical protein
VQIGGTGLLNVANSARDSARQNRTRKKIAREKIAKLYKNSAKLCPSDRRAWGMIDLLGLATTLMLRLQLGSG